MGAHAWTRTKLGVGVWRRAPRGSPNLSPVMKQGRIQPQKKTRLCHEDAKSLESPSCICVLGPAGCGAQAESRPAPKCCFPDQQPLHCKPILKRQLWKGTQLCAQALLPSCMEPGGTCLVGGVLVDDADVLAVREPQESEVLGSLQVILEVIEDLQQPEKRGLVGDCPPPRRSRDPRSGGWRHLRGLPGSPPRQVQGACLQSLSEPWVGGESIQPSHAPRG